MTSLATRMLAATAIGAALIVAACTTTLDDMTGTALHPQSVVANNLGMPTATPESQGFTTAGLEALKAEFRGLVDQQKLAGVTTLVARHGKVVHFDTYGKANAASGEELKPDSIFRIASMTKPITSVALLTLYERGAFLLDDPLSMYLPEFADVKVYAGADDNGEPVLQAPARAPTIHDVFRHTAGLSYGSAPEPIQQYFTPSPYSEPDLAALSRRVASMPLIYEPGTQWVYSFSHDIQARLVEVLSGVPFEDYVREHIFEPLEMNEIVFGIPPGLGGRFANTYAPEEGGLVVTDTPEDTSYDYPPFGGVSLSAPVMDYARFAQMLANSGELDGVRILSPRTIDLMAMNHLPEGVIRPRSGAADYTSEGYGLGVRVVLDPASAGNLTSAGAFGWSGAAGTHFLVDREEGLIAILMTQTDGDNRYRMREEFETMVYQAIIE